MNPAGEIASRLSDELDYHVIWQQVNAGIKLGPIGIPWNLNEGVAILARKDLHLEEFDIWTLSQAHGAIGNVLSFHFAEQNIALVGRIQLDGKFVYIINTHLSAALPDNDSTRSHLLALLNQRRSKPEEIKEELEKMSKSAALRQEQVEKLLHQIKTLPPDAPLILLGDFNAERSSPEIGHLIAAGGFLEAWSAAGYEDQPTWDVAQNTNIGFSHNAVLESRNQSALEVLDAWYDGTSRTIDFVFLGPQFASTDVHGARLFLNNPVNNLFPSDHFGVLVDVEATRALTASSQHPDLGITKADATIEPLPILSYDTDVGFGYGAKAFFLNQAGINESFDAVLFNSSEGERWYRFVFSVPDFELRQGKKYSVALDLVIDYDKWIRNSFFGVGNSSKFENREIYTREPLEISTTVSWGLSPHTVTQVGVKYKAVKNYNFTDTSVLRRLAPYQNSSTATYNSMYANYRFDSRNSFINPSRGVVFQGELEYAPLTSISNTSLTRIAAWVQRYSVLFYPKTVFALRFGIQSLPGTDIPVQMLLPIGGNQTLRGSPQDRFLDRTSAIFNAEGRFPLVGRLGGVAGFDAGKVWGSVADLDFSDWATNPVVGLRFYMDTFVVRLDVGFGLETTGFYLNFGHLF